MHEMSDRTERLGRLIEDADDVCFFRHIALDGDALAAGLLYRLGNLARGFDVADVIDCDVIAAFTGKTRGRCADAPAASGNEKNGSRHGDLLGEIARRSGMTAAQETD